MGIDDGVVEIVLDKGEKYLSQVLGTPAPTYKRICQEGLSFFEPTEKPAGEVGQGGSLVLGHPCSGESKGD